MERMKDGNGTRLKRRYRNDAVLIAAIACFALFLFALFTLRAAGDGKPVLVVTVGGEEIGRYPLSEDSVIAAGAGNTAEIRGGKVRMTDADCPDRLCVHSRAASEPGDTIVCLPNRVVLRIVNGGISGKETERADERKPDAVAG